MMAEMIFAMHAAEEDLQNHAEEVQKRFHAILEADRT